MQYGTKKTHENLNKETVSVESIWKQKPLNSWYERNLKSKNSVHTQMEEIRSLLHFIIQMIPNGSRVLPLSLDEVYSSLIVVFISTQIKNTYLMLQYLSKSIYI